MLRFRIASTLAVFLVLLVGLGQSASNRRAYVAGHFALDLDGSVAGALRTCDGAGIAADVIVEKVGSDGIIRKHIAGVKYEDITVTCGTGMTKGFYDWIKASFDNTATRRNGAIIAADFDYNEQSKREFTQALITEVGFPACDGAAKDPAYMVLKFAPETVQMNPGSGMPVTLSAKQKKWLPCNFRLKIDGLEEPCSRVNKIEAITVKQKVVDDPVGEFRSYVEVPNLVITLPESHAEDFFKWHEDFVIKGNNGDESEKGGSLEYLTVDQKTVLFTLDFKNLGIFKLTPDKLEAGSESIRRIKVEMYCEDIKFNYSSEATWQ